MLIAQAEGRHPASAAQDYHIIQNRPSLKADTMLARFQAAGGKVKWTAYTDTKVAGDFSHPQGGTVSVDWDMERAKKAGLGTKDNWKHYPRSMLRARVISEGVRTVYPAVLGGMYTPEEVIDFEPDPAPAPEPEQKVIETPKSTEADFDEMVAARGVGEATRPMLDEYIQEKADENGGDIAVIKAKAVKHQQRFWDGFHNWVREMYSEHDDEGLTPADEIPFE